MPVIPDLLFKGEYKYYDTPEGEDCHKKMWYVTKYCGIYGLLGSSVDILLYSHPQGYMNTLGRYAYITFPVMGMGAAFVATTCAANNIRKKDDWVNYALGGAASAAVLGAWQKSTRIGCYAAFYFSIAAVVKKDMVDNKWTFFGDHVESPKIFTNLFALKRDFSLKQDPGRDWKHSSEV